MPNHNQEIEKLTQQITNITTIFGPSITLKSIEFYLKASQREELYINSKTINFILNNTKKMDELRM